MSKIESVERNGILFASFDGFNVTVTPHRGRDAIRAARLIKKLMAPQTNEQMILLERVEKNLCEEEAARLAELREEFKALDGVKNEVTKKIEDEIEDIYKRNIKTEDTVSLVEKMAASLDEDQEAKLDALIFKHSRVSLPGQKELKPLSSDDVFDQVFAGKNCQYIEPLREIIIGFNGFLGNTEPTTQNQPVANS